MDDKLKKRIMTFYIAGVLNALFGLYVAIEGSSFLPADTVRTMTIVFLAFTAVNFYVPYTMKKKWLADNARRQAQGGSPAQQP
jgi:hypothetical protein